MVDIIGLLSTDGYIMCNKTLIKMYGGDCAILIGELCAEYKYFELNNKLEDGYFWSTQENIEENTGLNAYAQRKALQTLQTENIISVVKKGLPAKNYYCINTDKLIDMFTTRPSNFKQLDVQNLNINNNKTNKNNNSISNTNTTEVDTTETVKHKTNKLLDVDIQDYQYGKKTNTVKRKSLYEKCIDEIYLCTTNTVLQSKLVEYLKLRISMSDKKIVGVGQWKGMLTKLLDLADDDDTRNYIVCQSIEHGWASFYELNRSRSKKQDVNSEYGSVHSDKVNLEEANLVGHF